MLCDHLTVFDGQPQGAHAHAQACRGLRQVQPPLGFTSLRAVNRDLVVTAQRGDPFACPTIASSTAQAIAIEEGRDHAVATDARQDTHRLNGVSRRMGGLTTPSPRDTPFRMHTAFPVNPQKNPPALTVDIGNDLTDPRADHAFLEPNIRVRIPPHGFQISGSLLELIGRRRWHRISMGRVFVDACFEFFDVPQRFIPATLKLIGDQAVVRVSPIVLLPGTTRRITRRFEVSLQGRKHFVLLDRLFLAGQHSRLHGTRFQHAQHLVPDGVIHARASKRDAPRFAVIEPTTMTTVA